MPLPSMINKIPISSAQTLSNVFNIKSLSALPFQGHGVGYGMACHADTGVQSVQLRHVLGMGRGGHLPAWGHIYLCLE
jgi:hypothetical protein